MKKQALFVLLTTSLAVANMAAPWREGEAVGEPDVRLQGVVVQSELLIFDLRPLSQNSEVEVEALYQIQCDQQRSLPLVFVAPGLAGKASVELDQKVLESKVSESEPLPAAWKLPDKTPRPDGGEPLPFQSRKPKQCLLYTAELSPGQHQIKVHYTLTPSAICKSPSTFRFWQLGYVLAPARRWDGFANLEVRVLTPPHWKMASSLPLQETSPDHYQGKWASIPDDWLTLSAQAPNPPNLDWIHPVLGGTAAVACCLLGILSGRFLAKNQRGWLWAVPIAAMGGLASGVGFFLAAIDILDRLAPARQISWSYSYGYGISTLFLTMAVAVGGGLLNLLATLVTWKSASGALHPE